MSVRRGTALAIVRGVPGTWQDLEAGAPEVARLGMARLRGVGVALLGTLRRDQSPRISPVEPGFAAGHLLVGAIAWSQKVADLRRDPRYVLHSAVTGPDTGEGELKLYGTAVEADPDLSPVAPGTWWSSLPAKAVVFSLGIEQAVFIEWDTGQGVMMIHRWSPAGGYSKTERTYP